MKKIACVILTALVVCAVGYYQNAITAAEEKTLAAPSPNVVISQVFGGGGRTAASGNAPYQNDFVELFNRGAAPVSLNGWSIQYASADGSSWIVTNLTNTTLQPGQYYLIQFTSDGNVGAPLPTPDLIAPISPRGFIPNLSSVSGKLALVSSTAQLLPSACPSNGSIIDFLGYGNTASCSETTRTPSLTITTAAIRNANGCTDTDNNNADFSIGAPLPRNSSSAPNSCGASGNEIAASGSALPNAVSPTGTTLLRALVFPAVNQPSTNVSVIANLSEIGGSATQQLYDDGTNGDVVANDNVFSLAYTIPNSLTGGARSLPVVVTDAQARTANTTINLLINAPLPNNDPLILGNPSNATFDVNNPTNYLMQKPQYTLSYHRDKGTPNWVAWRLDNSWLGTTDRQDDFRPDETLPEGWYRVSPQDYTGSGYDRGHMCPSGDRTSSAEDNSPTFLMTNIIPQTASNNQGTWNEFESYCRTLARAGNELYIYSGGAGSLGTLSNGRVNIPAVTWKVVLVLPNGENDLERINKTTRTIAIVVPNQGTTSTDWRIYRQSVRQVESLTGYDFFSNLPRVEQYLIERRIDNQ